MFQRRQTTALFTLVILAIVSWLSTIECFAKETLPANRQLTTNGQIDVGVHVRVAAEDTATSGELNGVVVGSDGQRASHATVWLKAPVTRHSASVAVKTTTNQNGEFTFHISRGGAYVVQVGQASTVCRVWPANQAPPAAVDQLLLTGVVVRGQDYVTYDGGCDSCGVPAGTMCGCESEPVYSPCGECGSSSCGGCGGGGLQGFLGAQNSRNLFLPGLIGGAIIGFALDDADDDDAS